MKNGFGKHIRGRNLDPRRRDQNQASLHRRKVQPRLLKSNLVFLLRFLCGRDGLAQGTGMMPVKRHGHRIVQGKRLQIAGKHRGPGNRLQQRPMRAEGGHKRKYNDNFAQLRKHGPELSEIFHKVNGFGIFRSIHDRDYPSHNLHSQIHTNVPSGNKSNSGIKSLSAR